MSARRKYLSYYLFTMACILILCSVGIGRSKSLFSDRQEQYVNEKTVRIFQDAEKILDVYYRVCEEVAGDRAVKSLDQDKISEDEILAVQKLYDEVVLPVAGIRRVAIWLNHSNSIISNGSIYRNAQMNDFFALYDNKISQSYLLEKKGAVYRNVRGDGYVLITRKLYGYNDLIGSLLLEYDPKELQGIETGEMSLYIGNNQDWQYASGVCNEALYRAVLNGANTHEATELGETRCLVFTDLYSKLNTAFRVAVPEKVFKEGLYQFEVLRFGILFLCLLASIPFVRYFYVHITKPMEKLAGKIGVSDEKESVEQVVGKVDEQISALKQELHSKVRDNQYFLPLAIGEMLNRVLLSEEESAGRWSKEALRMMRLDPEKSSFLFCIYILDDPSGVFQSGEETYAISSYQVIHNLVSEKIFEKSHGFLGIDRTYFPAAVQCDGNLSREELIRDLNEIHDFLLHYFQVEITYTMPQILENYHDLRLCYGEIRDEISHIAFWERCGEEGGVQIMAAHQVPYYKTVRNLVNKLEEQDYEGAWEAFEQTLDSYTFQPQEDHNWRTDRYQIYVLAGMIVTAMYEQAGANELTGKNRDTLESLYQIDNIKEFRERCKMLVQDFLETGGHRETSGEDAKTEEIRQYVLEHYTENTLNVSEVANHFGKSKSHLSHLFKDAFGINISEYIQRLRVEKAKEELAACSVKEAVERSGFWDTQALTRAMKKYEGVTPGEFKKQAEKRKQTEKPDD